ncbi:MAG: hypothetical protein WBM01_30275 [Mycobacterium sp.]
MASRTTGSAPKAPHGWLQQMAARRTTDASSFSGPNETFMRYVQNPVFDFLCNQPLIGAWPRSDSTATLEPTISSRAPRPKQSCLLTYVTRGACGER